MFVERRRKRKYKLTVIEFIIGFVISKLFEVDLVAENGSNTTKALHELVAFAGSVGNELKSGTEVLVVLSNPLKERSLLDNLHLLSALLIEELFAVGLLDLGGVQGDLLARRSLQDPAGNVQVLVDNEGFGSTEFQSFESILNTVADTAGILTDLLKVFANQLLLLDKLDISESLSSEFDGLVEAVLTTVRHINDLDNLGLEALVEEIGLVEIILEIGGTSKNDTSNVDLVVGDEVQNSQLGNLADVVVTLFLTETGETQRRLTTTTVLLGKIDAELLNDVSGVSTQRAEQCTVTIHDNETELLVRFEQLTESLGVELVVTEVQRGVDWLERFEVNVNLSLLSFRGDDFTAVDNEAIWRDLVVELETLLGRGNRREDGQAIDTGLDVGGGTLNMAMSVYRRTRGHREVRGVYVFFRQHLRRARHLILGRCHNRYVSDSRSSRQTPDSGAGEQLTDNQRNH